MIRKDIEGLRGLAVLVVMLFHAGLNDWAGGFVGVDVFFVISGFLILPRILTESEKKKFSLIAFAESRIRRLVPAYFVMLVATLVAASLALDNETFMQYIRSLVAAGLFVSNVYYEAQSSYFEPDAHEFFILHSWSLSLEVSFYILFAVIAATIAKRSVERAIILLSILGFASFLFSVYLVYIGHPHAYYGVGSRLWEPVFAGLCGYLLQNFNVAGHYRDLAGPTMRGLGLAGIMSSVFLLDEQTPFPGMFALVPTISAMLVIFAPRSRMDPFLWVLSSGLFQWLGSRSYSLYLWHWPLIVSVLFFSGRPSEGKFVAALLLSLPLAEISYRHIERRFRSKNTIENSSNHYWLLLTQIIATFALSVIASTSLFEHLRDRLPFAPLRAWMSEVAISKAEGKRLAKDGDLGKGNVGTEVTCSFDGGTSRDMLLLCLRDGKLTDPVLVIGDSHARDFHNALRISYPDNDYLLLHSSGCAPIDHFPRAFENCFPDLPAILGELLQSRSIKAAVLASRWQSGTPELISSTIDPLAKANVPVLLVGPGPQFKSSVIHMLPDIDPADKSGRETVLFSRLWLQDFVVPSAQALEDVATTYGATYLDRLGYFCTESGCLAFVPNVSANLMSYDSEHLSVDGIKWLGERLAKEQALDHLLR